MMGYRAWVRAARAEMIRADAFWLRIRYTDAPIPFWPIDFPSELEGNPSAPMCW